MTILFEIFINRKHLEITNNYVRNYEQNFWIFNKFLICFRTNSFIIIRTQFYGFFYQCIVSKSNFLLLLYCAQSEAKQTFCNYHHIKMFSMLFMSDLDSIMYCVFSSRQIFWRIVVIVRYDLLHLHLQYHHLS